jgi:small subunit ribosomal protein S17
MAEETPETTENETPETPDTEAAEATEAPAAEATEAPAETAPAEPEVQLSPKERRQRRRQAAVTKRGSRRAGTPEERVERRKAAAEQRRRYRAKQKEKRAAQPKGEPTPPHELTEAERTGRPKTRQGIVVSDKADKTITVKIEVVRRHKRYQKILRSTQTLHAHDERNDAHTGDTVRVVECRPMSRTKRWRLEEVVERAR